jgi:hypothetical protein
MFNYQHEPSDIVENSSSHGARIAPRGRVLPIFDFKLLNASKLSFIGCTIHRNGVLCNGKYPNMASKCAGFTKQMETSGIRLLGQSVNAHGNRIGRMERYEKPKGQD